MIQKTLWVWIRRSVLYSVLYDSSDIEPVCRLDSLQCDAIASSIYTAFILVPMSGLLTVPASQPTKPLWEVYLWQGEKKLVYILSHTLHV